MPTSVRLDPATEARLEQLATATGRSKAFYLREHAGSQFDPAVVAAALSRRERIEEVHRYCGTASA